MLNRSAVVVIGVDRRGDGRDNGPAGSTSRSRRGLFLEVRYQRLRIAHLGDAPSRARLLIFEAFPDLVVLGTLIEPCQHLPRCRGHIRTLIILPSELLDRIPGVKPHDRNELYLIVVERPAEELDSLVSSDLLISYTREDLFLEKPLVLVGVLGGCPSVPDSSNHAILLCV